MPYHCSTVDITIVILPGTALLWRPCQCYPVAHLYAEVVVEDLLMPRIPEPKRQVVPRLEPSYTLPLLEKMFLRGYSNCSESSAVTSNCGCNTGSDLQGP